MLRFIQHSLIDASVQEGLKESDLKSIYAYRQALYGLGYNNYPGHEPLHEKADVTVINPMVFEEKHDVFHWGTEFVVILNKDTTPLKAIEAYQQFNALSPDGLQDTDEPFEIEGHIILRGELD